MSAASPVGPPVDYRALLARERCWDRETEATFERYGEPLEDCILQNREELIALCEFIERRRVRSYLEIGVWTGRLLSSLHRIFRFDLVAACDHCWAAELGLSIHLPLEARVFWGDSQSDAYRRWREVLGPIDLVLIDANHSLQGVSGDFDINRQHPHRFIALHDVSGARPSTRGVKAFWDRLGEGHRLELVRPHLELGLDHSLMGIGIWSATEDPAADLRDRS